MEWLWVIIGSALGGMARYAVSGAVARRIGEKNPEGAAAGENAGLAPLDDGLPMERRSAE